MDMKKPNFVVWDSAVVKNAVVLHVLKGVEKEYQLRKGVPRAATFPSDAAYTMHPDFPHNTILVDNLVNTGLRIVGSKRLKEFLEKQVVPKVEYLPVAIVNHKGKTASKDYFIVHPIEPVECLDLDKCGVTWGEVDETSIDEVKHLVIDETRVEPIRQLFRPKQFHQVILARRTLADAIDAAGFTGIKWIELDKFKS
jgi:hypothetical protein